MCSRERKNLRFLTSEMSVLTEFSELPTGGHRKADAWGSLPGGHRKADA